MFPPYTLQSSYWRMPPCKRQAYAGGRAASHRCSYRYVNPYRILEELPLLAACGPAKGCLAPSVIAMRPATGAYAPARAAQRESARNRQQRIGMAVGAALEQLWMTPWGWLLAL